MAYNLNDVENWKSFQVNHLFKGGLVIYIVLVYGQAVPEYQKPLWAILVVNVLQSFLRIKSMRMASKSNLLSKNVKPIVEYMEREDQLAGNQPVEPGEMEGYRYIVAGEHKPRNYVKRNRIKNASRSLFCSFAGGASRSLNGSFVVIEDPDFLTVDKIWRCKGRLLQPPSERALRLRDVCLSMALCKMINRRFLGCELYEAKLPKTRDFVLKGLLDGDTRYERAFRVIEVELGFVYDLYYTRYPYLYRKVRYFALCLPVTMVILCSWLTYELFREHKDPTNGKNAPLGTTVALMAVVTFLEAFQLYLHMASGWFKVALVRSYVTKYNLQQMGRIRRAIIDLLLRLKTLGPWEGKLGQYSLLQNYNATRRISKCVYYLTLCLVDKDKKGRNRGKLVKLSTQVKKVVIDSLMGTLESGGSLTNGAQSLRNNRVYGKLSWACNLHTVAETILVWHIATTICKHEFDAAPSDQDSGQVSTASSLSQYCAYLIAFVPDLLPGHSFDSAAILDKSIEDARTFAPLQGAKTMEEKCRILMSNSNSSEDLLIIKGARLARELTEAIHDSALRWRVLSEFWAEMLLYVAPCDDSKAQAHLEALARGGEFITHLWALLTHAGVLNRPVNSSEAV
ncbi:hypothetical protein QYE76_006744 [Lolium multiflorum]|uniref:DUF4220 domain-containing protein n=1 Tax=Lolium multiflorum TaxID=4521 RepID=A0AAD8RXF6_LOLMU|nr:hypothetical protein QYE76_006744 [Lolium multiflorum]